MTDRFLCEAVESRRAPALYYLGTEDTEKGPMTILEWNGVPSDYEEFKFDMLSEAHQVETADIGDTSKIPELLFDCPGIWSADNITRVKVSTTQLKSNISSDFLTVPPYVTSLMDKLNNFQESRSKSKSKTRTCSEAIIEEPETHENMIANDNSTKNPSKKRGRPPKNAFPHNNHHTYARSQDS